MSHKPVAIEATDDDCVNDECSHAEQGIGCPIRIVVACEECTVYGEPVVKWPCVHTARRGGEDEVAKRVLMERLNRTSDETLSKVIRQRDAFVAVIERARELSLSYEREIADPKSGRYPRPAVDEMMHNVSTDLNPVSAFSVLAARDERMRQEGARAAIEAAPCAKHCSAVNTWPHLGDCDCWKRDARAKLEAGA